MTPSAMNSQPQTSEGWRATKPATRSSVEVCAVDPVKPVSEALDKLQVAGSLAATGVMAQVRATVPVKPPEGVTLMVEVPEVLPPAVVRVTLMAPLLAIA